VLTEVSDASFADEVLGNGLPVFVDFWAEWCPPCHRLAPVLAELAVEYAGRLRFVKLNVDDNPATARAYAVMSLPTLIIFRDGEVASQRVGAQPKPRLRTQIDAVLAATDRSPAG
jgi:thioredoxin 1